MSRLRCLFCRFMIVGVEHSALAAGAVVWSVTRFTLFVFQEYSRHFTRGVVAI